MAIEHLAPHAPPKPIPSDLICLDECLDLLRETGHPKSKSTLWRWIQKRQIPVVSRGGKCYVSFSDILEAHRDAVENGD